MKHWKDPGLGDYEGMNPDRVWNVLFEAALLTHTHAHNDPAWLFAGQVFGVGPRVGMNLCIHAGLDPYQSVRAQRADAFPPRIARD